MLFGTGQSTNSAGPKVFHCLHQALNKGFGRGGSRCNTDTKLALKPFGFEVLRAINKIGRNAEPLGNLAQSITVGTGFAAYNKHNINLVTHEFYSVLAVLGGVTDVAEFGTANSWKFFNKRINN